MPVVEFVFWLSGFLLLYTYAGYPTLLLLLPMHREEERTRSDQRDTTGVSLIVPVYNERGVIDAKLENTSALYYPPGKLEVLFVSDGSNDGTAERISAALDSRTQIIELSTRAGKAAALNAGLARARGEIIVFSDASIMLSSDAILEIVRPFDMSSVGCVSGEDRIPGSGGEALYGRYELFIRRQESRVQSLVGASGCFYAQRRSLCEPFVAGEAPDFFSVLVTAEKGYRAVSAPQASGTMSAVVDAHGEFQRKVRTLLRGMTTLGNHPQFLNPFRYGIFALELFSHKILRWAVPFLLLALLVTSGMLAAGSLYYGAAFLCQLAFYALAIIGFAKTDRIAAMLPVRISLFFTMANLAVLVAWVKYLGGVRQEIWLPSKRS